MNVRVDWAGRNSSERAFPYFPLTNSGTFTCSLLQPFEIRFCVIRLVSVLTLGRNVTIHET